MELTPSSNSSQSIPYNTSTIHQYERIKQILQKLNYNFKLSYESLPLVDQLLQHIKHSANELQTFHNKCQTLENDNTNIQAKIEIKSTELKKWMEETATLRKTVEAAENKVEMYASSSSKQLKKSEGIINHLQLITQQNWIRISELENENLVLRNRIEETKNVETTSPSFNFESSLCVTDEIDGKKRLLEAEDKVERLKQMLDCVVQNSEDEKKKYEDELLKREVEESHRVSNYESKFEEIEKEVQQLVEQNNNLMSDAQTRSTNMEQLVKQLNVMKEEAAAVKEVNESFKGWNEALCGFLSELVGFVEIQENAVKVKDYILLISFDMVGRLRRTQMNLEKHSDVDASITQLDSILRAVIGYDFVVQQLLAHIKHISSTLQEQQLQNQSLMECSTTATSSIDSLEQQKSALRHALKIAEEERMYLHKQLEKREEENIHLKDSLNTLKIENLQLQSMMSTLSKKESESSSRAVQEKPQKLTNVFQNTLYDNTNSSKPLNELEDKCNAITEENQQILKNFEELQIQNDRLLQSYLDIGIEKDKLLHEIITRDELIKSMKIQMRGAPTSEGEGRGGHTPPEMH